MDIVFTHEEIKRMLQEAEKEQAVSAKPETKKKRLNLLVYPSVYKNITKIARMQGVSSNDYINSLMIREVEENQELIQQYNNVFKK